MVTAIKSLQPTSSAHCRAYLIHAFVYACTHDLSVSHQPLRCLNIYRLRQAEEEVKRTLSQSSHRSQARLQTASSVTKPSRLSPAHSLQEATSGNPDSHKAASNAFAASANLHVDATKGPQPRRQHLQLAATPRQAEGHQSQDVGEY